MNVNKVDRLKAFHGFIDDLEKGRASNGRRACEHRQPGGGTGHQEIAGRRKFNEDIDSGTPRDKYAEFSGSMTSTSEQNAGEATWKAPWGHAGRWRRQLREPG